jgi:hypothetical protein
MNPGRYFNRRRPLPGDPAGGAIFDTGGAGDGDDRLSQGFRALPAVYNNGGVVKPVAYLSFLISYQAAFAAAGFVNEGGFIVNINGVAVINYSLVTSSLQLGPLPFGTVETCDTLTKDGLTNITRLLARLGP